MQNHRWTFAVTCPRCARSGDIKVIEDAKPPFDESRRTYAAPAEFHVVLGPPVTIECIGCGAAFPSPR
jgi:hypothetical protein